MTDPKRRCHVSVNGQHLSGSGDEGLTQLAEAWHRHVLADPVLGHAFEHGFHPDHTRRLAGYWAEALGWPPTYTQSLGSESLVVRMHSGNGVRPEMDARGEGVVNGPFRFAFNDLFTFRDGRIARVDSYVVPLP